MTIDAISEHPEVSASEQHEVKTLPVTRNGVLPEDFYSTTNFRTYVRIEDGWAEVENIEMDVAIVVDRGSMRAWTCPMHQVRVGDEVVVGQGGIRVDTLVLHPTCHDFAFMQSTASSERTKARVINQLAEAILDTRARGRKVLFVLGPAVVHAGARDAIATLIRCGCIQVIFGGNALVTHDVEAAMFGTSLGIDIRTGHAVEHGHRNHLRAINAVRLAGSLAAAEKQGLLGSGIIGTALRHKVDLVLAGSIRDDGPMPGVITDSLIAQDRMREAARSVDVAVMTASMLHSIATGNLLPASVLTVAVDINPAVVTKLADRGTTQALGLVTDAELFLNVLADTLKRLTSRRRRPNPVR